MNNNDIKLNTLKTDLKSDLKKTLMQDFETRLRQTQIIPEDKCKRLCELLEADSISFEDITKILIGDKEQIKK